MRPLVPEDIAPVVELHRTAFGAHRPREHLTAFLTDILFEHPWRDEGFPSLAYVSEDGKLVGCLGAMSRPMMLGSRPIRTVVTHDFMVDPAHRHGLAAVRLLRAMVDRGPDLLLADGNEASRRIGQALGATVVEERSGRWLRI
ncbi:MAG TPA: GNAT family N-acetyltransferase, partial [Longimicrobiales bacterium]|nr:GNAT family N-acetyltransferase [Longimicrobiales bacterium]